MWWNKLTVWSDEMLKLTSISLFQYEIPKTYWNYHIGSSRSAILNLLITNFSLNVMYSYLYLYLFIKETVIYIDRIASREFLDQFSSSIQVCMFTNSLLIQTRERHSFQHKHSNVITNDYFIMSLSHLFMILRRYYNQQEFQSQRNLSF